MTGWVFGAWGEASTDVHSLVQQIAQARVAVEPTQPGQYGQVRSREAQLACVVGYIRRTLSFTAVQQQARLLLSRLQLLGDGTREAARRRTTVGLVERLAARERQAQAVCLKQGRDIVRRGFGKLD